MLTIINMANTPLSWHTEVRNAIHIVKVGEFADSLRGLPLVVRGEHFTVKFSIRRAASSSGRAGDF